MPIYEWVCEKCGKTTETLQKINDPAPECHGPMKKLISNSTFHLKGSGWYATDNGNKKTSSKNPKKS
jgi:putative FmdB family regulatory protein